MLQLKVTFLSEILGFLGVLFSLYEGVIVLPVRALKCYPGDDTSN